MGVAAASAVKETVTALSAGVRPAPARLAMRPTLDAGRVCGRPGTCARLKDGAKLETEPKLY